AHTAAAKFQTQLHQVLAWDGLLQEKTDPPAAGEAGVGFQIGRWLVHERTSRRPPWTHAGCSADVASCLASASASGSLAGSLPPAWAIVGLPPPPPATTLATWPINLP